MCILKGQFVSLKPISDQHYDDLKAIAADDPSIWTFFPGLADYSKPFDGLFDKLLSQHKAGAYKVYSVFFNDTDQAIGTTGLYDFSPNDKRVNMGFSWYKREYWGTKVNPEAKYLVLKHVFEDLGYVRVGFEVDSRNERSVGAVKKLGATQEGIMRKHKIVENGFHRNTVSLSIIDEDWPEVKVKLESRLSI